MAECAETNFGGSVWISENAVPTEPNITEAAAESYVQLPGLINHGDTGITQNSVSQSTWDNVVICKDKGEAEAQNFTLEAVDKPSSGQDAFTNAASPTNKNFYLIRTQWPNGKIEYNWGKVTGPQYMKGGNEDFQRIQYEILANMIPLRAESSSSV